MWFLRPICRNTVCTDTPNVMQVVIGTVLEGYRTLAKIASQQTFKPNQRLQQVSASAIGLTLRAHLELQVCMSSFNTPQRMHTGCSSMYLYSAA